MNRVWIIHTDGVQLSPAKLREIYYDKYPQQKKQWPPKSFTRKAYFDPKHAQEYIRSLNKEFNREFILVEYTPKNE